MTFFIVIYDFTHLPIVAPISGSNVSSVNLKRRLKEKRGKEIRLAAW